MLRTFLQQKLFNGGWAVQEILDELIENRKETSFRFKTFGSSS